MKIDLGKKTMLFPMPCLIIGTYDKDGVPNAMNAAWGGVYNEGQICICVDKGHKTAYNVKEKKAFTVGIGSKDTLKICDYVGIVSANNVPDKLAKANIKTSKSKFVDAPILDDLKMTLECELVSYDEETEQLIGNIVNICADESVLTDGKVDSTKLQPITFDPSNHKYVELGTVVGSAFLDGKNLLTKLE